MLGILSELVEYFGGAAIFTASFARPFVDLVLWSELEDEEEVEDELLELPLSPPPGVVYRGDQAKDFAREWISCWRGGWRDLSLESSDSESESLRGG